MGNIHLSRLWVSPRPVRGVQLYLYKEGGRWNEAIYTIATPDLRFRGDEWRMVLVAASHGLNRGETKAA